MFTKKLSTLLINCKSLLQRLDPAVICASHQNNINYFQCSCKYLRTSSIEHENLVDFKQNKSSVENLTIFASARKILVNSEIYANNLASSLKLRDDIEIDDVNQFLMKPWISMSNPELLENFEILSNFAKKNEENLVDLKFDSILEVIQNRCSDFSDDELYHLLKCLELWIIDKQDKKFLKFWHYIDNECLNRFREWSIDKVLLFNDQVYKLRLSRSSEFTYHSLKKIGYKPEKFSRANLIHFAFLTNANRKMVKNLYYHEYYVEKQIDKLSLEELGIFASFIIYYQSSIRSNEFLKEIIKKLKKDINVISDFALRKILQVLRLTTDEELKNEFKSLFELLETQTSTRPLPLLNFFADLQQRTLLHSPNLIKKILDRFEKDFKKGTIKDFEKIATTLSKFHYEAKDCKFYSIIMNELLSPDRAVEVNKYPKLFLNIVSSLLHVNFYSEEALKIVLDPEFLEKVSKGDKYYLTKDFLFIDLFIALEHPEYNGPRIQKDLLLFLMKRFGALCIEKIHKNQKANKTRKMIKEVIETCKQVFNSESTAFVDALLPHFAKFDIVICKDPNGNIISPEDKLSQIPAETIKYAPKDGNTWYALVLASFTSLTKETFKPTGSLAMELKYLELIGYTPILIPYNEWQNLAGEDERQKYIKEILSR